MDRGVPSEQGGVERQSERWRYYVLLMQRYHWFQKIGFQRIGFQRTGFKGLASEDWLQRTGFRGLASEDWLQRNSSSSHCLWCTCYGVASMPCPRPCPCPCPGSCPCAIGRVPYYRSPLLTYRRIRLANVPQITWLCKCIGAASVSYSSPLPNVYHPSCTPIFEDPTGMLRY